MYFSLPSSTLSGIGGIVDRRVYSLLHSGVALSRVGDKYGEDASIKILSRMSLAPLLFCAPFLSKQSSMKVSSRIPETRELRLCQRGFCRWIPMRSSWSMSTKSKLEAKGIRKQANGDARNGGAES